MKWFKSINNSNSVLDEHNRLNPDNNKYGPAEKKGFAVMIPISSIWRWFRDRKKK